MNYNQDMAWKNMLNEANILITAEFVCQLEHEQIHVNLQLGTTEQSLFIAAYKTHEGRSLADLSVSPFPVINIPPLFATNELVLELAEGQSHLHLQTQC